MTWDEFVQAKTLQPQASPSEQPSEENAVPTSEPTNKIFKRLKPKRLKKMCKRLYLYMFKKVKNLLLVGQRENENCKKKSLFW